MSDAHRSRILVVEDEPLVAMLLEDMLLDLGYEVVGPALRLEKAIEMAETLAFDAAILDVNLGDSRSYCIAKRLGARGIPYAFATGYGSSGLEEDAAPVVHKPYQQWEIETVLRRLIDGA
jgi:CheY-like chemotaxis protein